MNDQTQQFLYRSVIITVCGLTAAIFIFLFVAAITLGDGEAIRIIESLQPEAISCLAAMVATALGSHVAGAFIASQMTQAHIAEVNASAPVAAPAPATTATVTPAPAVTTTTTTTTKPASDQAAGQ